jgi:hypothetical protein
MKNIAISWVLYASRETVGLTNVRNTILQNKINKLNNTNFNPLQIEYGKTFTKGNTFNEIYEMIYNFQSSDKRFLIFTSNGEIVKNKSKRTKFSDDEIESHYISFILDKNNMKVIMIDPSRNNGKMGIYDPYIGICLKPFFEKLGYIVNWLEMTSPCQINYHDVFCQTWTMYLIYKWFKYFEQEQKIHIPRKQNKKYSTLLNFYKKLLNHSLFCKELEISYKNSIENHINFQILNNYDPSQVIRGMNSEDMNDY